MDKLVFRLVHWLSHLRLFSAKTKRNFRPLICILAICALSSLIYTSASVYLYSTTIHSKGAVKTFGVGVYWDAACSNPVSSLDWGIVEPGAQKNFTVYVKNEGNVPGRIFLSAANWNPPTASRYMTLTWDYGGQVLEPYKSVKVTLKLLISQDIQGVIDFNFDTVISIG